MKICFVCGEYPPGPHGGIGTFTQILGRALVAAGHEVRVTGVYPAGHAGAEREEDCGVQVYRMKAPVNRWGWPFARYRLYQQVARWSRQRDVDLIEAPDWEGWTAFWGRLPCPLIVRLHGSVSYFQRELQRSTRSSIFMLERAALRRADYWCSVSHYTAERTKEVFGLRSGPHAILYNPVEIGPERPKAFRSGARVVFTGTLTPKKGIISLARAWPAVQRARPDAELHVLGKDGLTDDGRSMRAFLAEILASQSNSRVHFHGHIDRATLFNMLGSARVAVFPSYAEAFALAPLEAMIQGCPTIYTRRGSGPELIEHGVDGLLIDPDEHDEIADAIVRVLHDDQLAARLSEAGQRKVRESFSLSTLRGENERFYQSCLETFHHQN
ncbi:MAG: glycosyltransferase family 4 protein [Pirellulaceae bacterium]